MKRRDITQNEDNLLFVEKLIKEGHEITQAVQIVCENIGVTYTDSIRRGFSTELEKRGVTNNKKEVPLESTDEYKEAINRKLPKAKYYLISSAQAETAVHKGFFTNMKAFAEHIGGEILICPARYKNPTSLESNRKIKDKEANKSVWGEEVRPFLYASRLVLNDRVTALMDLKVQPTAKLPLSGLNGFTGSSSAILPHPKIQMDSMPVLPNNPQKLLMTTGSVTVANYTDTKIGAQALFEHEFGFVLVEVVNEEKYFIHQVVADSKGDFYFLDYTVKDGCVRLLDEDYPAIVFGDIHYGETDALAYNASIGIAHRLSAQNVFLHDVGNMHSISHHELKQPFLLMEKEENGRADLYDEIQLILSEISKLDLELKGVLHVVESNHPLWIERWLNENDWRKSPNKRAYLEFASILANKVNGDKGILNYLIDQNFPNICTYTEKDSKKIHGYEMLIHGHIGASGSKGSIQQFKGLSTKGISAHNHTAKRFAGWLTAGTLTVLDPAYVKGLSAWTQSNVVIAPNGKPTHIHIFNGEYTTL